MNLDNFTSVSFLALAAVLLTLECIPRLRHEDVPIRHRLPTNLGLMLLTWLVLSTVFPTTITAVARELPGGLVRDLQLPPLLEVMLAFLLVDFWRYWEHRLLHEVPLLWQIHLVHHSDTAIDVTTAQRHHPFEIIVTTFGSFILVFSLGFSAQALAMALLAATLAALHTHTNIRLPESIDKPLRWLLVTPNVHVIHHSDYPPETDSNYGSVLILWDRLFGTYTDPTIARIPRFGLACFRQPQDTTLGPVLLQPFKYRRSGP